MNFDGRIDLPPSKYWGVADIKLVSNTGQKQPKYPTAADYW